MPPMDAPQCAGMPQAMEPIGATIYRQDKEQQFQGKRQRLKPPRHIVRDREAIRQSLLAFATEVVSAADQPKNLIRALAGVDRYVDRVIKAKA